MTRKKTLKVHNLKQILNNFSKKIFGNSRDMHITDLEIVGLKNYFGQNRTTEIFSKK